VQLHKCYKGPITRRKVSFNFSPRNLTQAANAMKPNPSQDWIFASVKNDSSRRGFVKDGTRIEVPKLL